MKFKWLIFIWLLGVLGNECFAQENIRITHGPYLQNLSDTSVTIIWSTNREAISWVELAADDSTHFYLSERPKFFSTSDGVKNVSKVHSVHLENLIPDTRYRYRVFSKEVKSHEGFNVQYGKTTATDILRIEPLSFKTSDRMKNNLSFLMVSDIHGRSDVLADLLKTADFKTKDMVFFNGDMVSFLRSEKQMFTDFMDTAVFLFAKEKPVYYVRGNHETRGEFSGEFNKYFPGPNGNLYYLLRQGPVCFVVLDCGEDKPDSDIEYSDITAFEEYRTKEAQWLTDALKKPDFMNAPFKIAIIHMPPFGGWYGNQDIANKFLPLLNSANIQLMLCGHLHKTLHLNPQKGFSDFPIIVNSNNTVLVGEIQNNKLMIKILNLKNEVVDGFTINP